MSKIREILNSLGYELQDHGSHYRSLAKYRNGHNPLSLAIKKTTGQFFDFGTNQKGSFKDLLGLIRGDRPQEIARLIEEAQIEQDNEIPPQTLKVKKVYPPEILTKLLPHWDYYLKQGISRETLELFQIGLAQGGKLNKRFCFPIYDLDSHIIGFTGRWYASAPPSNVPKYKHIGRKNEWVWPLHLCRKYIEEKKQVILVESPNCILHMWEANVRNVLCLFSTDISAALIKALIVLDCDDIVIATNNEPDNNNIGNAAAQKIRNKLQKYFDLSKIRIRLPIKKDFGASTPAEILDWYKGLTTVTI